MAYTTQAFVEAELGRPLTSYETTRLPGAIAVATAYIENETLQTFEGTSTTTRYYDGSTRSPRSDVLQMYEQQNIIQIDPCRSITSVTRVDPTDGTTILYTFVEHEDYELGPKNDDVKTYIEKKFWPWFPGISNVAVTGVFTSSDSVPGDIQYLASYIIAQLFLRSGMLSGLKRESLEGYMRDFYEQMIMDDIVKMILDKYRGDQVLL